MGTTFTTRLRKPKATRRSKLARGSSLVVVGNGMVGAKFCQELVARGLHEDLEITVVGAEPVPAYDRIRLSTFVDHRSAETLTLQPAEWYEEHGIELITGTSVDEIQRDLHAVRLSDRRSLNYQALVLATGSRPFVPPIEGADLPSVFVYRTIADLEAIIAASEGKTSATIIGGGLLGLEAAQAVQKLGLRTSVVERSKFLMPAQLNEPAARLLEKTVIAQNIALYLEKNSTRISPCEGRLELDFGDDETCQVDLVIISAGITPESALADRSGLSIGARGGVIVDDQLQTEDPDIFAIGECALVNGRIYGLAAPGYAMARHVANRLAGVKTEPFPEPDLSTRLKMLGADVVTIGDPLEEGRRIEFESEGKYRMLVFGTDKQIKGGLGVGPWPESGMVQSLFVEGALIRDAEQDRFARSGELAPEQAALPIAQFPDTRVICNCMTVNKGQVVACMASGAGTTAEIASATGASTVCGSCVPLLDQLCGAPPGSTRPVAARGLLVVSALALVAVAATVLMPPMHMATSVESWWYKVDAFWRDTIVKQITGYSLMAIFLVGLLVSLRKRFRWFRFGHFAKWRFFHAAFGLTALFALFMHTGFRFGHNLNFWLMFTFVGLNLLGAVAGIASAVESKGTTAAALRARRIRPALTYAHLVLFWPLPVLLTFHVLSVYLY